MKEITESKMTETTEGEIEKHAKTRATSDVEFRRFADRAAIIGTFVLAGIFLGYMTWQLFNPADPDRNWLVAVLQTHYAATIGTPMSAIAAFCIVFLLKSAFGPVEIQVYGVTFRGASGPIIFWLLCFASMVAGMCFLWNRT